ncbi:hypothetical protein GGI43DRAFT_3653 [Trichoderma evansii]
MEKAYPTKKSMARFACDSEATLSDPLTLLLPIPIPFFSLGRRKGRRFDKQNDVHSKVGTYVLLQRCSDIAASTSSSAMPETLFSSFQGLFGRRPEMDFCHLRNANASLFIRIDDITLFLLHLFFSLFSPFQSHISTRNDTNNFKQQDYPKKQDFKLYISLFSHYAITITMPLVVPGIMTNGDDKTQEWANKLVGKTFSEDQSNETMFCKTDLPESHRIIKPGQFVTRDFRPERLNVHLKEDGTVSHVVHG